MRKKEAASRVRYYDSFSDDFVESGNQSAAVPEGFKWNDGSVLHRLWSAALYQAARAFALPYCRMVLGMRIENHVKPDENGVGGCFLYGNHTQPVGDAFMPVRVLPMLGKKRLHVMASPANLGIPILGKILPAMGAIPIPSSIGQMKQFKKAVEARVRQGRCVVIYPEGHVWPYDTHIRPFQSGAFRFPVENEAPAFCMATTYRRRKCRSKPAITVYVDGPFHAEPRLGRREQQRELEERIRRCMTERSGNSNCRYVEYVRRNEE